MVYTQLSHNKSSVLIIVSILTGVKDAINAGLQMNNRTYQLKNTWPKFKVPHVSTRKYRNWNQRIRKYRRENSAISPTGRAGKFRIRLQLQQLLAGVFPCLGTLCQFFAVHWHLPSTVPDFYTWCILLSDIKTNLSSVSITNYLLHLGTGTWWWWWR